MMKFFLREKEPKSAFIRFLGGVSVKDARFFTGPGKGVTEKQGTDGQTDWIFSEI